MIGTCCPWRGLRAANGTLTLKKGEGLRIRPQSGDEMGGVASDGDRRFGVFEVLNRPGEWRT
jgi:hypothetical protein